MTKPKLLFGPEITPTGFSAAATALFNDLGPARIVREILQNSMDAAVEANEPTTRVRFRVTMIGGKSVPDLTGYTDAFHKAVVYAKRTRGVLSTPDQQVVARICRALEQLKGGEIYLLSIMDNGIGLDKGRMTEMLGDGTSSKSGSAAGSYGVGHFTAVPASDLRYIIYGGVQNNGRRIAAGCAFLASRAGQRYPKSARGYLIKGFGEEPGDGQVFDFINTKDIPKSLATDLSRIRKDWRHGTVIHIPAFNYFGYPDWWLSSIITKVAAYNFSAAICRGELEVEVDETKVDGELVRLDKESIRGVLEDDQDQKRTTRRNSPFSELRLAGQAAHSIYQVLQGESHVVETGFGKASIHMLVPSPMGRTRVDLFRNGMWIAEGFNRLNRSSFTDCQPFHAVLMPERECELHRLIRKAEGPMHDELSLTHLGDKDEKKKLASALDKIVKWIKSRAPELGEDEYTPNDYLVVETGGDLDGHGGTRRFSMYGTPVIVQRIPASEGQDNGPTPPPDPPPDPSTKTKSTPLVPPQSSSMMRRPLPFQSTVVPDGPSRHIVLLKCVEAVEEVALSLLVHENVDATCHRIWSDRKVGILSFAFKRGQKLTATRSRDGAEIRMRGMEEGETYAIAIEHEGVEEVGELSGSSALQVVLLRPPASKV